MRRPPLGPRRRGAAAGARARAARAAHLPMGPTPARLRSRIWSHAAPRPRRPVPSLVRLSSGRVDTPWRERLEQGAFKNRVQSSKIDPAPCGSPGCVQPAHSPGAAPPPGLAVQGRGRKWLQRLPRRGHGGARAGRAAAAIDAGACVRPDQGARPVAPSCLHPHPFFLLSARVLPLLLSRGSCE